MAKRLEAYLVLSCFTLPYFSYCGFFVVVVVAVVVLQIEYLWELCVKQVYWCQFPNNICSLHITVSHFGNSHISNFIICHGDL